MDTIIKTFNELKTEELYQLLQLRSEVFVVEQTCIYQDIDGKDQKAYHVLGKKDNELIAYARIFKSGDYFENISIGRVIVKEDFRRNDYGKKVMQSSLDYISNHFHEKKIEISAQTYLEKFYSDLGFKTIGKEYLEDGIPHVRMIYLSNT